MTTQERIAILDALAEDVGRYARELEVLVMELHSARDDMRASLGLPPIIDRSPPEDVAA